MVNNKKQLNVAKRKQKDGCDCAFCVMFIRYSFLAINVCVNPHEISSKYADANWGFDGNIS